MEGWRRRTVRLFPAQRAPATLPSFHTRRGGPGKLASLDAPVVAKEARHPDSLGAARQALRAKDGQVRVGDAGEKVGQPVGEAHPLHAGPADDPDAGDGAAGPGPEEEAGEILPGELAG